MQTKRMRAVLKHAYENVPFYHKKFRSAGVRPSDIKTVEDLCKVPLTTKSEVQAASLDDLIATNINSKQCTRRLTSGSTGIPLTVVVNSRVVDFENALWLRAYFENGMKPWHKMVRIADPHNFPSAPRLYQRFGLMRTKYISIFDDSQTQFSAIEEYKPDVIRGYTTSIESLAQYCKDNAINMTPLIFTSAELLDQKARSTINSAFRTELFDLYVSVEFGLIAWECKEHLGYHINADGLILEFVQNGEVTAPGESGEVVCTNLFNNVMPLIRYCIGDVAVASDQQCLCGISLPLMRIVEGRTGDYLIALNGRKIPPIVFFPFPFDDVSDIRQFKIVQEQRDRLLILIVAKSNLDRVEKTFERAERNLKSVFGENMHVAFRIVEKIDRDPTGKLRKIVSNVKMDSPV